jgi:hypothetical protein
MAATRKSRAAVAQVETETAETEQHATVEQIESAIAAGEASVTEQPTVPTIDVSNLSARERTEMLKALQAADRLAHKHDSEQRKLAAQAKDEAKATQRERDEFLLGAAVRQLINKSSGVPMETNKTWPDGFYRHTGSVTVQNEDAERTSTTYLVTTVVRVSKK